MFLERMVSLRLCVLGNFWGGGGGTILRSDLRHGLGALHACGCGKAPLACSLYRDTPLGLRSTPASTTA
eukprot:2567202-Amphidinium_carterae.1